MINRVMFYSKTTNTTITSVIVAGMIDGICDIFIIVFQAYSFTWILAKKNGPRRSRF